MSRVKFKKGDQKKFFAQIKSKSGLPWHKIAEEYLISARTLRDWSSEKYYPDHKIVSQLSKKWGISLPPFEELDVYWYAYKGASMGGKARYEKYGSFGTTESRKRGGKISQKRRREYPKKYSRFGCNIAKKFKKPRYSAKLAEMVGIILGDGSVNNRQMRVTLDRTTDREYAHFVSKLIGDVFGETPSWRERENVIELTLSGVGLVDTLERVGIKRGSKMANNVRIPEWIFQSKRYQRSCLRGLFDTDGGIYKHNKTKGVYLGWVFTSNISSLLRDATAILDTLNLKYSINRGRALHIYSLQDIVQYVDLVGSSNPKHLKKVKDHRKKRNQ